ncbi:delta 1-pyrroline-5-carboxylate reductase [Aspergillus niger]|nr:delta 1-pyrroline-5-carboxylate reductase [Aspergillus niger]
MSTPENTLAILGCGKMGIAILNGLLNTTTTTETTTINTPLPTHFIATVRSPSSLTTLQTQFQSHLTSLTIHPSTHNHSAITSANTIILACDPADIPSLLSDSIISYALCSPPPTSSPKLLISIAAGWTVSSLRDLLSPPRDSILYILRALPNICATISQSITAIELPSEEVQLSARTRVPEALIALTEGIFSRIGRTVQVRADQMDTFTVLGGSTPAFIAVFVEALVDGGVAMGLGREEARMTVAQVLRGTGDLLLGGEHPALLKERGTSPGGCTMGGLCVLEEGGFRGLVGRAVREGVCVAEGMGRGVGLVNGTGRK